ncbi:MAG: hypothetical protein R6W78_18030, partial [Bacteroidales bacterium]
RKFITEAFRVNCKQGIPCHSTWENGKFMVRLLINYRAGIPGNMLIFVAKIRWGNFSTMVLRGEISNLLFYLF